MPSPIVCDSDPSRATSSRATASGVTAANSEATPDVRPQVREVTNEHIDAARRKKPTDDVFAADDEGSTLTESPSERRFVSLSSRSILVSP